MALEWKDISNAIGKTAPILGTVLGGPAGGAIGALVSSALGTENNPDDVMRALSGNPEISIKLKQLENDKIDLLNKHLEKMAEIDLKYEENRVNDLHSARVRETESLKTGDSNFTQNALALVGVLAFFGFSWYIVSNGLPSMEKEEAFIVGTVIGSIMMIGKDIYGYYFGSSSGSKDKTKQMSSGAKR